MRKVLDLKNARGVARRRLAGVAAVLVAAVTLFTGVDAVPQAAPPRPPQSLQETELYADFATLQIDPAHLAF